MTLISLVSAKHSPGVTTTALALAAAWPTDEPVMVAELDPAGGDLAARLGLATEPGLTSLASASRTDDRPVMPGDHTQPLTEDWVHLLVGPVSGVHASASLRWLGERLGHVLRAVPGAVIADCGRWYPSSPATAVVSQADVVLIVLRPHLEGVEHARTRLEQLPNRAIAAAVMIGDRPYGADEISRVLGIDVVTVLPIDERGAVAVCQRPMAKVSRRSVLHRAARGLASSLGSRSARHHSQAVQA